MAAACFDDRVQQVLLVLWRDTAEVAPSLSVLPPVQQWVSLGGHKVVGLHWIYYNNRELLRSALNEVLLFIVCNFKFLVLFFVFAVVDRGVYMLNDRREYTRKRINNYG